MQSTIDGLFSNCGNDCCCTAEARDRITELDFIYVPTGLKKVSLLLLRRWQRTIRRWNY